MTTLQTRTKDGTLRDNQKQRLYDAESYSGPRSRAAQKYLSEGTKVQSTGNTSIEACQNYVDYVTSAAWFQARWGHRKIPVGHKTSGNATWDGYDISLPPLGRNEIVILHEIAHVLMPGRNLAPHGPEFAGVMLTLVRYVKGDDAAKALRTSFREHRVRVSLAGVPKPTKPVVLRTEQARVVRERKRAENQRQQRDNDRRYENNKPFAANLIRHHIAQGHFGPTGSSSRRAALATARRLEGK